MTANTTVKTATVNFVPATPAVRAERLKAALAAHQEAVEEEAVWHNGLCRNASLQFEGLLGERTPEQQAEIAAESARLAAEVDRTWAEVCLYR